jgi:hypothetical protein
MHSVGGLPLPAEADAIWEGIWYEEAHHSTAIEGNTLILKEVERLLRDGKAVGSKELAEYLEVEGYAKAAQWVYAQAVEQTRNWSAGERINLTELRHVHRLVVEPAWLHSPPDGLHPREGPGAFRQHDIRPFTGGMTPPPFPKSRRLSPTGCERPIEDRPTVGIRCCSLPRSMLASNRYTRSVTGTGASAGWRPTFFSSGTAFLRRSSTSETARDT